MGSILVEARCIAHADLDNLNGPCRRIPLRTFDDTTAEARYYRLQARDLQDELEELKIALSDFQSSSKELEDEMERELATNERRETELRTEAERLRGEVESWKVRVQELSFCPVWACASRAADTDVLFWTPAACVYPCMRRLDARTDAPFELAEGPLDNPGAHAEGARRAASIREAAQSQAARYGARQRRPGEEREVRVNSRALPVLQTCGPDASCLPAELSPPRWKT